MWLGPRVRDKGISEFITEFAFDAFLKLDVGTRGQVSEPSKVVVHTYT